MKEAETGPEFVESLVGSTPEKERLFLEVVAIALGFGAGSGRAIVVAETVVTELGGADSTRENSIAVVTRVEQLARQHLVEPTDSL